MLVLMTPALDSHKQRCTNIVYMLMEPQRTRTVKGLINHYLCTALHLMPHDNTSLKVLSPLLGQDFASSYNIRVSTKTAIDRLGVILFLESQSALLRPARLAVGQPVQGKMRITVALRLRSKKLFYYSLPISLTNSLYSAHLPPNNMVATKSRFSQRC